MIPLGKYVFKSKYTLHDFFKKLFAEEYDEDPCDFESSALGGYEFSATQREAVISCTKPEDTLITFDKERVESAMNEDGSIDLSYLTVSNMNVYTFRTVGVSEDNLDHYIDPDWLVQDTLELKEGDCLVSHPSMNLPEFKIRKVNALGGGRATFSNGHSIDLASQSKFWKILPETEIVKVYKENESKADHDTRKLYEAWVVNQKKIINDTLDDHYGIQNSQETTKMSKVKQVATAAVTANKTAGIEAAKLKVGKTANNLATKMLKPKLPMGFKGAADHPLFKVAVANAASIAVQQVAGNNPKALAVSEAMMTAAYLEFMDEFDIESMLDEILGNFKGTAVDKITDAKAQEIVIDE